MTTGIHLYTDEVCCLPGKGQVERRSECGSGADFKKEEAREGAIELTGAIY